MRRSAALLAGLGPKHHNLSKPYGGSAGQLTVGTKIDIFPRVARA